MRASLGIFFVGFLLFAQSSFAQLSTAEKDAIGYTALQSFLGPAMPTGAGVSAATVEATDLTGAYRVDGSDSQLSGKTFVFPSGGNTSVSSHATTVARYLLGTSSLAPGIGNSTTTANYEVNNYLQSGSLRAGSSSLLPAVESRDIVNHSWVGSTGNTTFDTEIARRMDYAIQRDDFIATIGLNNGSGTSIPNLLASSYNGLIVGLSNGNHSRGTTQINGTGRTKPDIVIPTSATSWAAPTVASAAGLLLQTARTSGGTDADRSVVIKSALLAGAARSGPDIPFVWTNSTAQPLDSIYGAGQLNIFQSYQIMSAGRFSASASSNASSTGWDYGTASSSSERLYFFDISTSGTFSVALTWNVDVTATDMQPGPGVSYAFTSSLADLNLRLYQAVGFSAGSTISSSLSTVDNVELISLPDLTAGRYAIGVTSNTNNVGYGLSWQVIPEPATWAVFLFGGVIVFVVRAGRLREKA